MCLLCACRARSPSSGSLSVLGERSRSMSLNLNLDTVDSLRRIGNQVPTPVTLTIHWVSLKLPCPAIIFSPQPVLAVQGSSSAAPYSLMLVCLG